MSDEKIPQRTAEDLRHKAGRHGHSKSDGVRRRTRTYRSWEAMRERCLNPRCKAYKNYGGRGITICARWLESFENFLADMKECPPGLTIEREDNDGNYEPGNCKWASRDEQARNRRNVRHVELNGQTATIMEWAKKTGIPEKILHNRLFTRHWTVERALNQPLRRSPMPYGQRP